MVRKMLAEMQPFRKIVRVDLTIFYLPDEPFRKIVRVDRAKL